MQILVILYKGLEDSPILVSMGDPQPLSQGVTIYCLWDDIWPSSIDWKEGLHPHWKGQLCESSRSTSFFGLNPLPRKIMHVSHHLLPWTVSSLLFPFLPSLPHLSFDRHSQVWVWLKFLFHLCEWQEVLLSRKWMGRVSSLICISKNLSDLFLSAKVNQRRAILIVVTRWWIQYIHMSLWAGSVVRGTCLCRQEGNGIMRV